MSVYIEVEGNSLSDIWAVPQSNELGTVSDGAYISRVVHTTSSVSDADASLVNASIQESESASRTWGVWLDQSADPLQIYSTYRSTDPFLCFSCTLQFDFRSTSGSGVVTVSDATDTTHAFSISGSYAGFSFTFDGTTIAFSDAANTLIFSTRSPSHTGTAKFVFYLAAQRVDTTITGGSAAYKIKAFVAVGSSVVEIWSDTLQRAFLDKYRASFKISSATTAESNIWDGGVGEIDISQYVFTTAQSFKDGDGLGAYPDGGVGTVDVSQYTFTDGTYVDMEQF
jgi:hypothetical protein